MAAEFHPKQLYNDLWFSCKMMESNLIFLERIHYKPIILIVRILS